MTSGLQIALMGGTLFGVGIALLLWRILPANPDPADVVRRFSPQAARSRATIQTADHTSTGTNSFDKVGEWVIGRIPAAIWGKTPTKELNLLGIPLHRHYGKKVLYGIIGLVLPPLVIYFFVVLGIPIPFIVPVIGSIGLAVLLFVSVDFDVRARARDARIEFGRAMGAYCDLVALERITGSGPRQSMEHAAEIGDSWVFRRISQELSRSRWASVAAWDALHALADELGLPELDDVADIMRLSNEGSQIYNNLRARSSAMRTAMLNDELAKANAVGERMSMPMSMLGIVFMALLIAPSLLRVMTGA